MRDQLLFGLIRRRGRSSAPIRLCSGRIRRLRARGRRPGRARAGERSGRSSSQAMNPGRRLSLISSREVASPPVINRMTSGSASRSARLETSDIVNWRSTSRSVSRRIPSADHPIMRNTRTLGQAAFTAKRALERMIYARNHGPRRLNQCRDRQRLPRWIGWIGDAALAGVRVWSYRRRLQPGWLIHTDTWAGSRAFCTTLAKSSRTASRSTASCRRAANAVSIRSAS
jgi:hypothetical protein